MPHLPGNIAQRLAELRYQRGLTQEQLSKEMYAAGLGYYDRSTISRAESGGVTNVSSELVMALSKYFDVTADFLLGLTDIPDKKNYELSELGLSYEAARKLLFREVDPDALNRFIECGSFAELTERIADFYHSSMTEIYAKADGLFRGIRDLSDNAEDLGYVIPESEKESLKRKLSVLPDPVKEQKRIAVEQFKKVMDELADMMRSGVDPKAMVMDDDTFRKKAGNDHSGHGPADAQAIPGGKAPDEVFASISKIFGIPEEGRDAYLQLLSIMNKKLIEKNGTG
ncbi:MAG: helix-turn-helix transcriptional regulator [Eubacterium sp.]|nr:helix-turn-helix transcriptional regulator [Eubacterium sp.]